MRIERTRGSSRLWSPPAREVALPDLNADEKLAGLAGQ
jgi:hypothetical protein